jgi:hypothetical protein
MSSSVKLSFLNQIFSKYDIDKSGTLDDSELAKASLNLLGKNDAQSQAAGELFSTFLQGGKDQKGLFPDFDNDNAVSKAELAKLAGASGSKDTIDSSDFKAVFGDKAATDGGNTVDLDNLQQVAEGNLSKFDQDSPSFEASANSLVPGGNYAIDGQSPDYGQQSQDQGYYPQNSYNQGQGYYPQQGYGQYSDYGQQGYYPQNNYNYQNQGYYPQQGYSNYGGSGSNSLQGMMQNMMALMQQFVSMFQQQQGQQ